MSKEYGFLRFNLGLNTWFEFVYYLVLNEAGVTEVGDSNSNTSNNIRLTCDR